MNCFLSIILLLSIFQQYFAQRHDKYFARCQFDLQVRWSRSVGHTPFAGAPLITDINGDGQMDIVAATFSDEVMVLQGNDGHPLPNARWPFQLVDTAVYASPILYDINKDGLQDILLVTSDAELMFFKHDGFPLTNYATKLPGVLVDKKWPKGSSKMLGITDVQKFVQDPTEHYDELNSKYKDHTLVDAHVLATPVIADINKDGVLEELVIPVSYYYDLQYYNDDDSLATLNNMSYEQLGDYLVGGVTVINMTSLQPMYSTYLELTKTSTDYPAYMLVTPTLVDLDSEGGPLEIILGSGSGQLHVLDHTGHQRQGFPVSSDSIHSQVAVGDVNFDGKLEIIFVDRTGNVMCYSAVGMLMWKVAVSGSSAGLRLADVNNDQIVDIVIATDDGQLWVLEGARGIKMTGWPVRVGRSMAPPALVAHILHANDSVPDIVAMPNDGHLHIISGNGKCKHAVDAGEASFVSLVMHDLDIQSPGLEMVVASNDGRLVCLARSKQHGKELITEEEQREATLNSWPAESNSHGVFQFADGKQGVFIVRSTNILDLTGSSVPLTIDVIDALTRPRFRKAYQVYIYYGNELIANDTYSEPGRYSLTVPAPNRPLHTHLHVRMYNHHGQLFQDTVALKVNLSFLQDLKWLFLGPVFAMGIILLLLHGFPEADLLPLTWPGKIS